MKSNSKKIKRVLLMYITKVSGHRQGTIAIQKCLKDIDPMVVAPMVNGFGYTYPILEKVVHHTYMGVIKATPFVWDYMYDNPKIVRKSQSIKRFLHRTSHDKIKRLFDKYRPDAVVCTQAFPCGMVADFKRKNNLDFKLIGVLTDFAPHSFWVNEGVDYYVVPSDDARKRFITKGVDSQRIKIYGIPLKKKFAEKGDINLIASKLGLDSKLPTILIMGGGHGLGPMKNIVKSLIKIKKDFQIIAILGTNKTIIRRMKKFTKNVEKKVLVYEFANNVDELMDLATLVITKPGGITTAECLAKGVPMLINNPIPGQEMRNADFLIKNGIGIRIDDASDIGEEVEILLNSSQRLKQMKQAALKHANPNSAKDIARLILDPCVQPSLSQKNLQSPLDQYV